MDIQWQRKVRGFEKMLPHFGYKVDILIDIGLKYGHSNFNPTISIIPMRNPIWIYKRPGLVFHIND